MIRILEEELGDLENQYKSGQISNTKFRLESTDILTQLRLYDRHHPALKKLVGDRDDRRDTRFEIVPKRITEKNLFPTNQTDLGRVAILGRLKEAKTVLNETEVVADTVLTKLIEQKEQIKTEMEKIETVKTKELPQAGRSVSSMLKCWK